MLSDVAALSALRKLHPYTSAACAICRRVGDTSDRWPCQTCGSEFHASCFWRLAASARERGLYALFGAVEVFVCAACRS